MKTISRYIMTLALLLTAVGGAWAADTYTITFSGFGNEACNKTVTDATLEYSETFNIADVDANYTNFYDVGGSNEYVSISQDNTQFTITVKSAFEGTVNVTVYYLNGDGDEDDRRISVTCVKNAPTEPGVDVTTNAASKQDLFTEAWFNMPTFDATVNYELVRDMQDQANPVAFSGLPSSGNIVVKKGDDGKYQPIEALTIQLIDPLAAAEAQNIIAADGITIKVLVGAENGQGAIDYDQENPITLEAFLADMKPGYYWIKAVPTDETTSPYIGTVYSSEFTVVEKYDLTVKPANDFSKGKIESVTVGSGSVTIDANTGEAAKTGIDPDTEVKVKAKRGYVIDKVEVKKTMKLLTLTVNGVTIYYAEGETWAEAIQNHPTENQGWEIYDGDFVTHDNLGFLMQNDNFVPSTAKIDPNASYDNSGV